MCIIVTLFISRKQVPMAKPDPILKSLFVNGAWTRFQSYVWFCFFYIEQFKITLRILTWVKIFVSYLFYINFIDFWQVINDFQPHFPPEPPIYSERVDIRMIVSKLLFQGKEITKSTPSESVEKNTDKCRASQDLIFENYDDEEEVSFNSTRFDWKLIAIKNF